MRKWAVITFVCFLAAVVAWLGFVPPEIGKIPAVNSFLQKNSKISCMSFHPKWLFFRIPRCSGVDVVQGQEIPIKINSMGLRGQDAHYVPFKNVFRILVVGDSSVFGTGALEEFTLPRMLEEELNSGRIVGAPKVEVLNGGLDGAVPIQMALLAERWIKAYKPHLVLVHFSWFQQLFYNYALSQNADWKDGRVEALRSVYYSSGWPTFLPRLINTNLYSLNLMRLATERVSAVGSDGARMEEVVGPAALALKQLQAVSSEVGSRFLVSFSTKLKVRNTYTANTMRSGFLSNLYYRLFINGLLIDDFAGVSFQRLRAEKIPLIDIPVWDIKIYRRLADGMHLGQDGNRELVRSIAAALQSGGHLALPNSKRNGAPH